MRGRNECITTVIFLGLVYTADSCNMEVEGTVDSSNITSPGYPNALYPNNLNCWWKVVVNASKAVYVEVKDLLLESSTHCVYDSLTFYDGVNSSYPKIATICGSQKGNYFSTGGVMFIQLKTDNSRRYSGFKLMILESPHCGMTLTATTNEMFLLSPGYPNYFLSNLTCTWIITAEQPTDTIFLHAVSSRITSDYEWTCDIGNVTVYNGNVSEDEIVSDITNHSYSTIHVLASSSLGTYCGYDDMPSFQSSKNQLIVVYTNILGFNTFKMIYKAVKAVHCNVTTVGISQWLYFVSPGYPNNYYSNMFCVWTFSTISTNKIKLKVESSDIQESDNCNSDSVTVYSGLIGRNKIGSFCGKSTPTYLSDSSLMTVVFKTDGINNSKGFRIGYWSTPSLGEGIAKFKEMSVMLTTKTLGYKNEVSPPYTLSRSELRPDCRYVNVTCGSEWMYIVIENDILCFVMNSDFAKKTDRYPVGILREIVMTSPELIQKIYDSCRTVIHVTSSPSNITSPGYPQIVYPSDMDCWWTVVATTRSKIVVIEVVSLDIDYSPNCTGERITFYDGYNSSAPRIGSICGIVDFGGYYSTGGSIFIDFISNSPSILAHRGFLLRAYERPGCMWELTANTTKVELKPPTFNDRYYNNMRCTWVITAENPNDSILLDVSSILADPCSSDYAEVYSGNASHLDADSSLGAFCGNSLSSYQSWRNQLTIVLITDGTVVSEGFTIRYSTVTAENCGFDTVSYRDHRQYIFSPGYPHRYFNNLFCPWTIFPHQDMDMVIFKVLTSDIQESANCTKDYVSLTSDDSETFCGRSTPTFHASVAKSLALDVEFITDGKITSRGFKFVFWSVANPEAATTIATTITTLPPDCGQSHLNASTEPRFFQSPLHRESEDCIWTFTAFLMTQVVRIEVENSDLHQGDCQMFYVNVFDDIKYGRHDGHLENGTSFQQQLAGICTETEIPYKVQRSSVSHPLIKKWCELMKPTLESSGRSLTLQYRLTSYGRYINGFNLKYFAISNPNPCGGNLTAFPEDNILTSPEYPLNYKNNQDCVWTIETAYPYIRITVLETDVESSTACVNDYVQVNDGPTVSSAILGKFCSTQTPTYLSTGNNVTITFHSNSNNTYKGFKLMYAGVHISNPSRCMDNLTAFSNASLLMSPGYPVTYKNNMDCVWTITTAYDYIQINVLDSDIETSTECVNDFVQVNDGPTVSSKLLGKFCGTQTPTYLSTGNYMTITFHSDNNNTSKGFKLKFTGMSLPEDNSLNVGAVVGGAVGGVIVIIVIFIVIIVIVKNKRTGFGMNGFRNECELDSVG